MDFVRFWIRLLCLTLILWSIEVFKEIRNALGIYYDVNNAYRDYGYMGMTIILVGTEL
jgi:hypothetical protein